MVLQLISEKIFLIVQIYILASTSRLDLILTEQRIHHLAILRLDEKIDKILSKKPPNSSEPNAELQST